MAMARTRGLLPIALLVCLLAAGCLGRQPTGLEVDAYGSSTISVTSWANDADRTLTLRVAVVRGNATVDAAARTLDAGGSDDAVSELSCLRPDDGARAPGDGVHVAVVEPSDGSIVAERGPDAIPCRAWPTVWSLAVDASGRVEVERVA